MSTNTKQSCRVRECFDMQSLRLKADIAQHWRRRLTAISPAEWIAFVAMFGDEIKGERARLAGRIRGLRHRGGIR